MKLFKWEIKRIAVSDPDILKRQSLFKEMTVLELKDANDDDFRNVRNEASNLKNYVVEHIKEIERIQLEEFRRLTTCVEAIEKVDKDLTDLEKAVMFIIKKEGVKEKIYDERRNAKV